MDQPCYIDLKQARQVLAEMGVELNSRQMKRAADKDAHGNRKLPFFVDPIEGKLKIEKGTLVQIYRNLQIQAENGVKVYQRINLGLDYPESLFNDCSMADIRKRTGKKGVTYQVRYPSKAAKTGYAFATFPTLKEARAFVESGKALASGSRHSKIRTVDQAIDRWLEVCRVEGRKGKDPVSAYTMVNYEYRADLMRAYRWEKELHELDAPDIVAFRSWLLRTYSRDQARKALSSFHSMILEMNEQGVTRS